MGLGIVNRTLILRWPRGGTDSAGVQGCGISRTKPDFLREVLIAIATPEQPDMHRTQWLGELRTLAFRGMLNVQSTNPGQFVFGSSSFLRFSMLEKSQLCHGWPRLGVSSSVFSLSFPYGFYFFKCTSFFFAGAVKFAFFFFFCTGECMIIREACLLLKETAVTQFVKGRILWLCKIELLRDELWV